MRPRYCRVAVDSAVGALDRPFDYEIPERMRGRVDVGSVVRVVLHGRGMRAFVTDLLDEPAVPNPRPLKSLVSPQPLFARSEIELARWTARRYVVPLGVVLHDAVPGRFSAPIRSGGQHSAPPNPPDAGESCLILGSLRDEPDVIRELVGDTRALVICPRVDLAESIAARIDGAALLHGEERPSDRAAVWASDARVVVGGRSGLFVPRSGLELVVVAGAHDRSLKAERAPRLHALWVARERARMASAGFVAVSPGPPVELAARIRWRPGPKTNIKPEVARPRSEPVTPRLLETVRWAIERGGDALVFAARRGEALRLRCTDCGWRAACEECGGIVVVQRRERSLVCRSCGHRTKAPEACPVCGGALVEGGWGHERIARAIERGGISAPVIRIVAGSDVNERSSPAVIVGTLAAAYVVRDAASVCVADLDQLLARADFRAAEYALQTLNELAGSLAPGGRFLVQTREPEHHVVQSFTRRSYKFFFDREIEQRRAASYPPFCALVKISLVPDALDALRSEVASAGGQVIGALPQRARMSALVRAPELEPLLEPLRRFSYANPWSKIDVDPVDVV